MDSFVYKLVKTTHLRLLVFEGTTIVVMTILLKNEERIISKYRIYRFQLRKNQ